MDLEGLANRLLDKGFAEDKVTERLILEIQTFKAIGQSQAARLAEAVLKEVKATRKRVDDRLLNAVLGVPNAGATMHDLGVGCRGEGDFFVHRLITDLAGGKDTIISAEQQDDAGAVKVGSKIIVASIDGTHSRLSDFPFIAGFHVARAAIRDVMAKGATPVALIDDMHLADDGDVGKLFDFVAGIAAVSELSGVPLISGSTLRVGGDMVLGNRMVSGVGCVGVAEKVLRRADVKPGDVMLMTHGAGGGTVATTAIYSGYNDIVKETLNIDFIKAVNALIAKGLTKGMHAMLDVTNGGLRGDANEVCKTAGVGIELHESAIRGLVNEKVFDLLKKLNIDYLGVSLDSLLIFCPEKSKGGIIKALKAKGVNVAEVGRVVRGGKAFLDGREFAPKFRESAYTAIKKAVGEHAPEHERELKEGARNSAARAKEKIKIVVDYVRQREKEAKKAKV